jgi:hypothetical protein
MGIEVIEAARMDEYSRERVASERPRRIVSAVFSVALACAAGSACGKSLSAQHPGGDPDGRLLAALNSVVVAAPPDAQIVYVHKRESHLGSCDGMAGAWGWTNVGFEAGFASSKSNNRPRVGWAFKTSATPPGYPVRGC